MTSQIWRRAIAVTAAALVVATAGAGLAGADEPQVPVEGTESANAIEGQYIVVMRQGAQAAANRLAAAAEARRNGAQVQREYGTALQGFAAVLPARALEALRRNPNIAYIEADQTITLNATQSPATGGLDRVDQRALPLNNSYTYNFTGSGVTAYIIDTGVRISHTDFGGRAVSGFDAIDWVTGNHAAGAPAVANMSLGGSASSALDTAVRNSIADGITYAVAAGNSNANACNESPARVAEAITVGSTTTADARSSFSNYGTCLDIFAPGSSITSAWYTSDTATNTISGTSMASPHVAGAAALFVQQNGSSSPVVVRDGLVNSATTGVVTNAGTGSPNRLLYTLGGSTPPPPPPPGCGGLPEQFTGTLTFTGDADYRPSTSGFSAAAGTHLGCLDGPTGVDFDLILYRKNSSGGWTRVATAESSGPDESITYTGSAGTYRWRVLSYSGTGSYSFGMQRP